MKVPLSRLAHTRSGDKGDVANVGVVAWTPGAYRVLLRELTPERVREFLSDRVAGEVRRYELPNLHALNFVMERALGGGGTVSLRIDAQGKTYGAALLRLEVEVDEHELEDEP